MHFLYPKTPKKGNNWKNPEGIVLTQRYTEIMDGRRIAAFLGGAGSGKTEIALNFALGLRGETERTIHFFDMDQTKPLFRARDAADTLREAGIVFHSNLDTSIEDVAAIAPGVIAALEETDSYVILDIGGNEQGARVIGQFFERLNRPDSVVFLPINPYRPWSGDSAELRMTVEGITRAARIDCVRIVSNPNFCAETRAEDVISGNEKLKSMLGSEYPIAFVCAREDLCAQLEGRIAERLIPIRIRIRYPWMEDEA